MNDGRERSSRSGKPPRRAFAGRGVKCLVLAAILVFSASPLLSASPKVDLRPRPRPKAVYNRRLTYTQKMTVGAGRIKQDINRVLAMAVALEVRNVSPGGEALISGVCRSMMYIQSDITGATVYDSENPGQDVPEAVAGLAPLIGRSFLIKVTAAGKIESIEGADAGVAAAINGCFPPGPVAVGDKWANNLVLSPDSLTLANDFTLQRLAGGSAQIAVRSTISQDNNGSAGSLGPLVLGYGLSGTQEGIIEVEESSGIPIRVSLHQELSGSFGLEEIPIIGGEITVPLKGTGTISLEPY